MATSHRDVSREKEVVALTAHLKQREGPLRGPSLCLFRFNQSLRTSGGYPPKQISGLRIAHP